MCNRTGHGAVFLFAILCVAVLSRAAVRAESLWARRDPNAAFLYRDQAARDIGDSVTVVITDSSSFKVKDSRDMEKESDLAASASLKRLSRTMGSMKSRHFLPYDLEEKSSRGFKGGSAYTGDRTFADVLTATVVDKLPNGNLVIAGRSERDIAGEEAVTVLTGIIRPQDVTGGNTVSSRQVARLELHYETTGPSRHFVDQGLLGRLLNFIWPF